GVHGEVDAPGEEPFLQLLHEQALAARGRQRTLLEPIAGRPHEDQLDRQAGMSRFEVAGDGRRLGTGERTAPGTEPQPGRGRHDGYASSSSSAASAPSRKSTRIASM